MAEGDLQRIEAMLGIRLPDAYRQVMVPFRIPACARNADTELWDDPDKLIDLNHELRAGTTSVRPWPAHLFALGRDGGGSTSAINLRNPSGPVQWADRCHLADLESDQQAPSFEAWFETYLEELRAELESNGIDPNGTSEERLQAEEAAARAGCRDMLMLVVIGVIVVLAVFAAVVWVG